LRPRAFSGHYRWPCGPCGPTVYRTVPYAPVLKGPIPPTIHSADGSSPAGRQLTGLIRSEGIMSLKGYFAVYFDEQCARQVRRASVCRPVGPLCPSVGQWVSAS
jgi:hypothetical protein